MNLKVNYFARNCAQRFENGRWSRNRHLDIPTEKRNYTVTRTRINYHSDEESEISRAKEKKKKKKEEKLEKRRGRNLKTKQQSDDNLSANHSLKLLMLIHSYR